MLISESILNQYTSTFSVIILFLMFSLNQFFEAAAWWVLVDASAVRMCLAAAERGSPCPEGQLLVTMWHWRRKAKGEEGAGERTRHLPMTVPLPDTSELA